MLNAECWVDEDWVDACDVIRGKVNFAVRIVDVLMYCSGVGVYRYVVNESCVA